MKKFLIYLLVVFVLGGVFFAGAVFGERTQRELLLDYSDEEETKADSANSEVTTVTDNLLAEMLEDYFTDGDKYDYDEFWSDFRFAEVHPDGHGVAISAGSGGAGSMMESWFFTDDGGKSWTFGENKVYSNGPGTIAYIGDTVIRTSYGGADVFSDNGKTLKKEVSFAELTGLSAEDNEAVPSIVSINRDDNTIIYGFGAINGEGHSTDNGFTYMAEFNKELNFIREIYKR